MRVGISTAHGVVLVMSLMIRRVAGWLPSHQGSNILHRRLLHYLASRDGLDTRLQRIYIETPVISVGSTLDLSKEHSTYLSSVLRMRQGYQVSPSLHTLRGAQGATTTSNQTRMIYLTGAFLGFRYDVLLRDCRFEFLMGLMASLLRKLNRPVMAREHGRLRSFFA